MDICYSMAWLNILYFNLLKVKVKVAQLCPTLCDPMDYRVHGILQARILYRPWESPGHNTGVGSYSLLQEIFPTQA